MSMPSLDDMNMKSLDDMSMPSLDGVSLPTLKKEKKIFTEMKYIWFYNVYILI